MTTFDHLMNPCLIKVHLKILLTPNFCWGFTSQILRRNSK